MNDKTLYRLADSAAVEALVDNWAASTVTASRTCRRISIMC